MIESFSFSEVLHKVEGKPMNAKMNARIVDGYTRHVGIGDGIRVPEVDFRYRPVRGPDIQEHVYMIARSVDGGRLAVEGLADRLDWWEAGGYDSVTPTADELLELDGLSFRDVYDVVFNGAEPARVFDRDEPQTDSDQQADDTGNSSAA